MWLRLDAGFAEHPKVLEAGSDAVVLYLQLLGWSTKQGTDGRVPDAYLSRLDGDLVERLVDVRLLDRDEAGSLTIHDFLDYQTSASEWKTRGEQKRAAGRAGASARYGKCYGESHGTTDSTSNGTKDATTRHDRGGGVGGEPKPRGTRVPIPFEVDESMKTWAHSKVPNLDWRHETEKFVDHFKAVSGQRGVKLDWPATWRNWMRNAR